MYQPNPKIIGYHGTYADNIDSIVKNNFKESVDHTQWFGDGVYFFIDGVCLDSPTECALQFAIDQRNRDLGTSSTKEVCVLEAIIRLNPDKMLDLSLLAGIQLFNKFRTDLLESIELVGKKPSQEFQDYHIFQKMREVLGIEFVKGNVYIKFAIQRKGNFPSGVPNVTIFVVNNPIKNIQKPSIKRVK